jgi:hypothetical protein
MAVVLDTDHLSVLQWQEQPACDRLLERLDDRFTSSPPVFVAEVARLPSSPARNSGVFRYKYWHGTYELGI